MHTPGPPVAVGSILENQSRTQNLENPPETPETETQQQ